MKGTIALLTIAFFLHISFSTLAQTIWYVDADATGAGTGTSWADAFTDLQSALAVAQSGDQVWVAEGVYRPDSVDRWVSFELKNGVQMYGGFGGWESSLGQRDWEAHPAVLSGEIGDPEDSTDNSCHVVYMQDVDSTTVLDGFVVRDGHADCGNYPGYTGGGLLLDGRNGGYVYARIRNCIIEENYALSGAGAMVAGNNYGSVAPQFYNCTFRKNRAGSRGGGLYRHGGSFVETWNDVWHCEFYDNYAYHRGGGIFYEEGPGIDRFELVGCEFVGNWTNNTAFTFAWFGGRGNGTSALVVDSCFFYFGDIPFDGTNQPYSWYVGPFYYTMNIWLKNSVFEESGKDNYFFLDCVSDPDADINANLWMKNVLFRNMTYANISGFINVDFSNIIWDNSQAVGQGAIITSVKTLTRKALFYYKGLGENNDHYGFLDKGAFFKVVPVSFSSSGFFWILFFFALRILVCMSTKNHRTHQARCSTLLIKNILLIL